MTLRSSHPTRRGLLCGCAALAAVSFAGCGRKDATDDAGKPREIAAQSSCSLDGMLLSDYAGPKGQILYKGSSEVAWFCDSMELLSTLLKPEQVRPLLAAHVQDMAQADWDKPVGHWIDARQAVYVLGSKRHGSMGPTAASFADEAGAKAFAQQWGGRVLRYAEITPEMADLSGGALHDSRM
jgi:copper chaperone NosL